MDLPEKFKIKSVGIRAILISAFFFSLMNICVKKLPNIPSHEISLFRAVIAFIICYVSLKRLKINPWHDVNRYLIFRGVFGTIALLSYFYTLQNMPLASAVTIQYLSPIFSTILALFILGEKSRPIHYLFFLISFSGILLIKGFDSRISSWDLSIGIFSALFSGLAYNYVRKLKDYSHPLVTVFYFPLMSMPIIAPYSILNWVQPQGTEWIYLILVGIFTQTAQVYMTKAYQAEQMSVVANFNYIGAVYALVLGYLVFGETVGLFGFLGICLIIGGALLSSFYKNETPIEKKVPSSSNI
jgi:drug/metabolite transporter (DMT)-like permease